MLILKKVAITGGLSSGKSSVCQILKKMGAFVVSADDIVHQLLTPQSIIGQKVVDLLGKEIVDGLQFNREKIAKKIFNNSETLKSLEKILHPAVLEEIDNQFNQVNDQKNALLFVAEIPLLYEIESQHLFDTVVVVFADPNICQQRFQEKTNHSIEEFEKRMIHQLPLAEKKAKANYVITNNGNFSDLKQQVETLYQNLTK